MKTIFAIYYTPIRMDGKNENLLYVLRAFVRDFILSHEGTKDTQTGFIAERVILLPKESVETDCRPRFHLVSVGSEFVERHKAGFNQIRFV